MTYQESVIKKIVLDVLKPHEPSIIDFATTLTAINGIDNVNVTLVEIDQDTESVKILVVGNDVDIVGIRKGIEELGAVIHSVDEVTVAKKVKP